MLDLLFGSKLRAKVLGWLMMHPGERYFVRQVTSILSEDSTNVSRELAKLASWGILTSTKEGRQKYYQVNQACPVLAELRGLVLKTVGLADVLRSALEPLSKKISVALVYGSLARNAATAASDVDVLVVGPATFGEVSAALRSAQETLGREINPTVYPVQEFKVKVVAGHHFLTSVLGEERILIVGDEHELAELAEERLGT